VTETTSEPRAVRWARRGKRAALILLSLGLLTWLLVYLFWPPRKSLIPRRFAQPLQALSPETSSITMTIKLPLKDIEADINRKIPQTLVDTKGVEQQDGVLSDVLVVRNGKVKIKNEGGLLVAYTPITIETKVYAEKRADRRAKKGKLPQKGTQFKTGMEIKLTMNPKISEGWSLQLNAVLSHRWTSSPKLRFGPFTFSVEKLADKYMKEAWPEVSKKINAESNQKDDLRKSIEEAWAQMHIPRQLKEEPPTWFSTELDAFYASDPKITSDSLDIVVGLLGRFSVALAAPTDAASPPLPGRTRPPKDQLLRLALSVQLPWEAMTEVARSQLIGKSWPLQESGSLRVTDASLYPSGEAIVVAIGYLAEAQGISQEGTLYFQGRLLLNEVDASLQIKDFDYTLDTQDEVVLMVNDLVQSKIKDEVQQQLSFPFAKKLEEARVALNQNLVSSFTEKGGTVEGEISTLSVRRLRMDITSLALDVIAEGELLLSMKATPPKK
jgi:hypothetical protein